MSVQAALYKDNPLYEMLEGIAKAYREGEGLPRNWESLHFGKIGIDGPHRDSDLDGEYIRVGFVLPDDVYAEIEDETYGMLNAFRIYKEPA